MQPLPWPSDSFGAFDLGRSDDFAAWCVLWEEAGIVKFKVRSYTCADRPDALKRGDISRWISEGYLVEHPGNQVDFDAIRADIIAAHRDYGVSQWAFDEQFAKIVAQDLMVELGNASVVKFVQANRHYNEPCRSFLKKFKKGEVVPDNDPCLL